MAFFTDLILLALLVIFITAFLGIISSKLAELVAGRKGYDVFEQNVHTKQGWKSIERKKLL